jgi:hypothetical protein
MATIIDHGDQVSLLTTTPRAIAMVSVEWSPWHRKSRHVLAALEDTREHWTVRSVSFFELWPEREQGIRGWYNQLCQSYAPEFELHGHVFGPLWWLVDGDIVGCQLKPYELGLRVLQARSASLLEARSATSS